MPFVMLLMIVSDYIQETGFYIRVKDKSDFLGWWVIAIPFIAAVIVVYYLIPVLTCMLYLETFSIVDGAKHFSKIMLFVFV